MQNISVILTTSPIPSHPSTKVLEATLNSLSLIDLKGEIMNYIIVFDGYKESIKESLKSGNVSTLLIQNYELYKANARDLLTLKFNLKKQSTKSIQYSLRNETNQIQLETYSSQSVKLQLLIVNGNALGFAHAVNCAIEIVNTALVLVLQHDWKFMACIPFLDIIQEILEKDYVNYITFATKWNIQELKWDNSLPNSKLKRLLSWYDRNHLAKVSFYKTIFRTYRFKRGYFIEDTYGQYMLNYIKKSVDQEEYLQRHSELGTFIYDPEPKEVVLRHMNGRRLIEKLYFKE